MSLGTLRVSREPRDGDEARCHRLDEGNAVMVLNDFYGWSPIEGQNTGMVHAQDCFLESLVVFESNYV